MTTFDSRSPEWLSADEPLPLEVIDAIRVADQEDGTIDQVSRLEARLGPLFGTPPSAQPSAPEGGAGSGSLGMLKVIGIGVALVGVAALVWPRSDHGAQRAAIPAEVARDNAAQEPAPSVENLGAAADELEASGVAAPSPVLDGSALGLESKVGKRRIETNGHNSAAQDTLALEARLLSRARRTLERQPEQALKLAEQHQARFPQGALSEEREVIAIKALRQMGKEAAAAQRQGRFLSRYPESPHALSLAAGARP